MKTLIDEFKNISKRFSHNEMIVNLEKFKFIIIKKNNETVKTEQVSTGNDVAEIASSAKLLGIRIDDQLTGALSSLRHF